MGKLRSGKGSDVPLFRPCQMVRELGTEPGPPIPCPVPHLLPQAEGLATLGGLEAEDDPWPDTMSPYSPSEEEAAAGPQDRMAAKQPPPLMKKHSQTDLVSRLKTRKILGVGGEDDDGEVHRSKVGRAWGPPLSAGWGSRSGPRFGGRAAETHRAAGAPGLSSVFWKLKGDVRGIKTTVKTGH